jgi:hypothetical protein
MGQQELSDDDIKFNGALAAYKEMLRAGRPSDAFSISREGDLMIVACTTHGAHHMRAGGPLVRAMAADGDTSVDIETLSVEDFIAQAEQWATPREG